MSILMRDVGMSTRVWLAATEFRIRASMSAIESVVLFLTSLSALPAALRHTGHVALERELAEAQAAERELPHVRAGAAAEMTPVAQPNLVFRLLLFFRDLCSGGHIA